jgi:hypothetical protein
LNPPLFDEVTLADLAGFHRDTMVIRTGQLGRFANRTSHTAASPKLIGDEYRIRKIYPLKV